MRSLFYTLICGTVLCVGLRGGFSEEVSTPDEIGAMIDQIITDLDGPASVTPPMVDGIEEQIRRVEAGHPVLVSARREVAPSSLVYAASASKVESSGSTLDESESLTDSFAADSSGVEQVAHGDDGSGDGSAGDDPVCYGNRSSSASSRPGATKLMERLFSRLTRTKQIKACNHFSASSSVKRGTKARRSLRAPARAYKR